MNQAGRAHWSAHALQVACALSLSAGLAGCPPDLRFAVEGDATIPDAPDTGRPIDAADADAGSPDGATDADAGSLDGATDGSGCAFPYAMVAVQDLVPGGTDGRVLRFELPSGRRCGDLTAGGQLRDLASTVAPLGPDRIVVGTASGIQVIDTATDSLVNEIGIPSAGRAVDSIVLRDTGGGAPFVVVATESAIVSYITHLVRVAADGTSPGTWVVYGVAMPDIRLGSNIVSIAVDPKHAGWFLALNEGSYAAIEVDPWTGTRYVSTPYVPGRTGILPRTLSALDQGGTARIVWTGFRAADGARPLYYARDSTRGDDLASVGPRPCASGFPTRCDWYDAVVDPTSTRHYLGICQPTPGTFETRHIVRIDEDGICTDMLDSVGLGMRPRMQGIAIHPGML